MRKPKRKASISLRKYRTRRSFFSHKSNKKTDAAKGEQKETKKRMYPFSGIQNLIARLKLSAVKKGQETVSDEHRKYGIFAQASYQDNPDEFVQSALPSTSHAFDASLSDHETSVFVDHAAKQVITSFRGTAALGDLGTDTAIAAGLAKNSARYASSSDALNAVFSKYGDYSHTLTGHSLGGYLATELGKENRDKVTNVYAYNPGSSFADTKQATKDEAEQTDNSFVNSIYVSGDPISISGYNKTHTNTIYQAQDSTIPHLITNITFV